MNEIDWTKATLYVYADRTGLLEEYKDGTYYSIEFEWFIDSCIDNYFVISADFEPVYINNDDTGDTLSVPSEPYQEYIRELIEDKVNDDPESLGLDTYLEDKYLDFD
jgi:hypothetical protein